jgi:hypothetical protein
MINLTSNAPLGKHSVNAANTIYFCDFNQKNYKSVLIQYISIHAIFHLHILESTCSYTKYSCIFFTIYI